MDQVLRLKYKLLLISVISYLLFCPRILICADDNNVSLKNISLGFGWKQVEFDRPTYLINEGSKITIEYIKNPATGFWEKVWGNDNEAGKTLRKKWIDDYLEIEGPGDDVHSGAFVRVLKPVTIAVIGLRGDKSEILFKISHTPINIIQLKSPPIVKNLNGIRK